MQACMHTHRRAMGGLIRAPCARMLAPPLTHTPTPSRRQTSVTPSVSLEGAAKIVAAATARGSRAHLGLLPAPQQPASYRGGVYGLLGSTVLALVLYFGGARPVRNQPQPPPLFRSSYLPVCSWASYSLRLAAWDRVSYARRTARNASVHPPACCRHTRGAVGDLLCLGRPRTTSTRCCCVQTSCAPRVYPPGRSGCVSAAARR